MMVQGKTTEEKVGNHSSVKRMDIQTRTSQFNDLSI
jgi:hypothetical protein